MSEQQEPEASDGRPETADTPTDGTTTRRRRSRRVVRQGTETQTVWGVTGDDAGGHDDNDDRLRRDVPPHW
ncbi:hypothetical protein ATJ88_2993 [Isoptericola jiangsuensis]|uniref:Uncharacterized protein n=1 Tax=Isoptericola jiangsuensis TaxID=548579 RepID=A0A2A9F152_9MICO|nr:hypothetical protein [Isoptericola jiangsuensis]PFG44272.1 hypothetical protein ATJ88_2993 [Isoptericola jiangsuensis]